MAEPDTSAEQTEPSLGDLQAEAERLGVAKSGTKAELQQRIAEASEAPATEAVAPADPTFGVIPAEEIPVLQGTGTRPPGPEAQPAQPLESGHKGKATVRTRHPVDVFEHGVDGVEPITAQGVEVGPSKVDDLLKAAQSAGTELEVL